MGKRGRGRQERLWKAEAGEHYVNRGGDDGRKDQDSITETE